MKLRNKQTGEIKEFEDISRVFKFIGNQNTYNSLAEFIDEWEDYEETKEYWYLLGRGEVCCIDDEDTDFDNRRKAIGNYFETKEEAEKAVEKLKAWKRLKDKGFRFTTWGKGILLDKTVTGQVRCELPIDNWDDVVEDLDLLFGGEE